MSFHGQVLAENADQAYESASVRLFPGVRTTSGLKVVVLSNDPWGLVNYRSGLLSALREAGAEVITASPDGERHVAKLGRLGVRHEVVNISRKSWNPLTDASPFVRFVRFLRAERPDAVLSFTIKANVFAGVARRLPGVPPFAFFPNVTGLGEALSSPWKRRFSTACLGVALPKAKAVFVQNDEDLDCLVARGLLDRGDARRVPGSGVDLDRFSCGPLPVIPGRRTFVLSARIHPAKGFLEYVRAAERLGKEFGDRVTFKVMGIEDPLDPRSAALAATLREAHERGVIEFLGGVDDVVPALGASDVVVLPSTYDEGVPKALLEGLSCGRVIVTTDRKGCRETVRAGVNGGLYDPSDPDGLYEAMRRFVTTDDAALAAAGGLSRALAERSFDERLVIGAYFRELGLAMRRRDPALPVAAEAVAAAG